MDDVFTQADAESMLEKLRSFAETLEPAERAALNHVGLAAAAELNSDVEGFSNVAGAGMGRDAFPTVLPTPTPAPVPIPYPNVGHLLASSFPL